MPTSASSRKNAQPFDFRRPSKFSREHTRALQVVHETFARQLSTVLATTLRTTSNVSLTSVEQLTYDEYIAALPNPSLMIITSLEPLPGAIVLQLPLPIAFTAIDRLLGGTGDTTSPKRPLTDIESTLLRSLLDRALRELEYSYETLTDVQASIVQQEFNPQFVQVAAPSDMVLAVAMECRIGEKRGAASICIPFTTMQPLLETLASETLFAERGTHDTEAWSHDLDGALHEVPIEVKVRFPEVALTGEEILGLRVGDVIPLNHELDDPLPVLVDGVVCCYGVAGTRGRRLACLIVSTEEVQ